MRCFYDRFQRGHARYLRCNLRRRKMDGFFIREFLAMPTQSRLTGVVVVLPDSNQAKEAVSFVFKIIITKRQHA